MGGEYHTVIIAHVVISIGWERSAYQTNEDLDTVELCAVVRSLSQSEINRDAFSFPVGCSSGSAGYRDTHYNMYCYVVGAFYVSIYKSLCTA